MSLNDKVDVKRLSFKKDETMIETENFSYETKNNAIFSPIDPNYDGLF